MILKDYSEMDFRAGFQQRDAPQGRKPVPDKGAIIPERT
jgi:hypothetical protein